MAAISNIESKGGIFGDNPPKRKCGIIIVKPPKIKKIDASVNRMPYIGIDTARHQASFIFNIPCPCMK